MPSLFEHNDLIKSVVPRLNRFLAVRDRAKSEVRNFILQKNLCSKSDAEVVLNFLHAEGFLNDERFARNRLDFRQRRGYGPRFIRNELRAFRIDDSLVHDVMDDAPDDPFLDGAHALLAKKLPKLVNDPNATDKLRAALFARGFTESLIDKALLNLQSQFPHWAAAAASRR